MAKVNAYKSLEEALKVAKEEGIELTDEQLSAVSGGCGGSAPKECPFCGSKDIDTELAKHDMTFYWHYNCKCKGCGAFWEDND